MALYASLLPIFQNIYAVMLRFEEDPTCLKISENLEDSIYQASSDKNTHVTRNYQEDDNNNGGTLRELPRSNRTINTIKLW